MKLAGLTASDLNSLNIVNKLSLLSQLIKIELPELIDRINQYFLLQNHNHKHKNQFASKVCPHCLSTANYSRSIWDCSLLMACPHHKCLLLLKCTSCKQAIKWSRPGVQICRCGFDFRYGKSKNAHHYQLLFSHYLYALCGDDFSYQEIVPFYGDNNPIFELSILEYEQFSQFFFPYVTAYLRHHQFLNSKKPIFTDSHPQLLDFSYFIVVFIFFQNWQDNFSHVLLWYYRNLKLFKTKRTIDIKMQDLMSSLYNYFPSGGIFHQFLDSYKSSIKT